MSHHEMRATYVDALLRKCVEEPRTGESRWDVVLGDTAVAIVLVEEGVARVECSATVGTRPPGPERQLQLQGDMPFGRLDVRDADLVVSHTLLADGITGPALDNAIRFVAWAAEQVVSELDVQPRLDGIDAEPSSVFGAMRETTASGAVPEGVLGAAGYL